MAQRKYDLEVRLLEYAASIVRLGNGKGRNPNGTDLRPFQMTLQVATRLRRVAGNGQFNALRRPVVARSVLPNASWGAVRKRA